MDEILPIASGIALGALSTLFRMRPWLQAVSIFILAACATMASGEYRISWGYVLLDLAEVILSSVLTIVLVRGLHRRGERGSVDF